MRRASYALVTAGVLVLLIASGIALVGHRAVTATFVDAATPAAPSVTTTTAPAMAAPSATATDAATPRSAAPVSEVLYRDPNTSAAAWVSSNPSDPRAAVIRSRIVSQPQARWFTTVNVSSATSDASSYVNAADAAGQVPVLTVYGITDRDCGGASSGGASSLSQYQSWIGGLAKGLGSRPLIVVLEPDSIALQSCLGATDVSARDAALSSAVRTLKGADASAKVYLDGGHSAWNSAADQSSRLLAAGVRFADGFFTNVSNFNSTANEAAYGRSILATLSGSGVTGKHQVIDTSRNGGASGDWCADDNTDRRLGQTPTLSTGDPDVDAYLWVKRPGEADGCAFPAGSFQPTLAASLANN